MNRQDAIDEINREIAETRLTINREVLRLESLKNMVRTLEEIEHNISLSMSFFAKEGLDENDEFWQKFSERNGIKKN